MKTKVITGCILTVIAYLTSPAGACTHNVYVNVSSVSPGYTINVGQQVTLTRSASCYCSACSMSSYSWSAAGASPSSGTGNSFTCSYSTSGTKTIKLTGHCASGYTGYKYIYITVNEPIDPPTVENRLPQIDENIVVLKGEVTDTGGAAPNVNFYYDTSDHGTAYWPNQKGPYPAGTKTGHFASYEMEGTLDEGTVYYFRTKAWNSAGEDWDNHTTHSTSNPIMFTTAPGRAHTPSPEISSELTTSLITLEWQTGTSNIPPEHRVYLGNSYLHVIAADTNTPDIYKGQYTGLSYEVTDIIEHGETYYWRIDEVVMDTANNIARVRKGLIWSFKMASIIDNDGDGMDDGWEIANGLNTSIDDSADDPDFDDLTNLQEFLNGTNPNDEDTDDDGIWDGDELNAATGSAYITDPLNPDTDNDGIPDGWEVTYGPDDLDPTTADSDTLLYNIPALWWFEQGIEPSQENADADIDADWLTNYTEYTLGTNPHVVDTDGDGLSDGWEHTYGSNFEVTDVQEALDPTQYDAYTKTVGNIPAHWWYTWWMYCYESTDPAIHNKYTYFEPTTANASEDANLDNDTFTNLMEYQNSSSPLVASQDDYWVEYTHDEVGNVTHEKQYVYENNLGVITEQCIAETVYDYDDLGRRWRTRQKANPGGSDDPQNDRITLTQYNVDDSTYKTIQKGYAAGGSANTDDDAEQSGDIVTTYTYDAIGRQYQVTDATGEITTYHYHASTGLLETVDLPTKAGDPTRTISYLYDEIGRVEATINPEDDYEIRTYDSMSRVIKSILYEKDGDIDAPWGSDTDPLSADDPVTQRRMEYDNLGTMVKNIVMADASNTGAYNTSIDRVTENEIDYDDINRTINSIIYSDAGEIVDSTWSYTDVENDASGRGLVTEVWKGTVLDDSTQPMVKQFVTYNAAGQVVTKHTDHFDHFVDRQSSDEPDVSTLTKMQYDDYGRLAASAADPDGDPETTTGDLTTTYDYWGSRKIAETDPENNTTAFEYDAFGNMKKKTEDSGGLARVTEYTYNRLNNLVKLTADDDNNPGNGVQETVYAYDAAGQVTKITYPNHDSNPNNDSITYAYSDPAAGGRPTLRTDQKGITTKYIYDKQGNLLQKQNDPTSPTVVEKYTYDARGLMLTAKKGTDTNDEATSVAIFNYDGLGYLETVTQQIKGGTARTIAYEHNQIGRPTKITYPDASATEIGFSYTSLGQIDVIQRDPDGVPQELANYDYFGSLVDSRSYTQAGVTYEADYDEFGRITRHTTENGSGEGVYFGYAYDDNGNITMRCSGHFPAPDQMVYTYDDLNRLTSTSMLIPDCLPELNGVETFNYDLLGNRDSVTDTRYGGTNDTYGPNNTVNEYSTLQVGSDPIAPVTHDDNGNLTGDHRGYSYIYDDENRLVAIRKSSGTISVAAFEYDALGRRIEKVDAIAGTTTRYYYDDQRVLLETDATGTETDIRCFVYGNYIDEVLLMVDVDSTNSVPDGDYYYGHDHLYSVYGLFDAGGQVAERYDYDAYGKTRVYNSDYSASQATSQYGNPTTFTGRRLDRLDWDGSNEYQLNLMYYRARTYDPQTGRFMQRDPLGVNSSHSFYPIGQYKDGVNIYQYVRSDPLNAVDPSGLEWRRTKIYKGKMRYPKPLNNEFPDVRIYMDYEVGFTYGCNDSALGANTVPVWGTPELIKSNVYGVIWPHPDTSAIVIGVGISISHSIKPGSYKEGQSSCPKGQCGSIDHVRIEITWQITGTIDVGIGPIGAPVHTFPTADIKTHTFRKDVKCCK